MFRWQSHVQWIHKMVCNNCMGFQQAVPSHMMTWEQGHDSSGYWIRGHDSGWVSMDPRVLVRWCNLMPKEWTEIEQKDALLDGNAVLGLEFVLESEAMGRASVHEAMVHLSC